MPRPPVNWVTFSIDGREVKAPENSMLVDGAKYGDVEIPVFCYEPKLGQPVGACRMCLVEIEGIPKLQTACSTPVKDGMVVHTQTERVHAAQRAVVEFLLINHPLDCPVCDKGGECPLQDVTYGWGAGTSRFIEPKRHFRKPLELSPLIAIDRERCILCYRCVRFSQEVSEDYQLILLERGAHTYVGTFDGHPYVAPFSGNIIELCPVGGAHLARVPLPRAPVGHRGRRDDLHDVPRAVQRRAHRARRPRMRVLARDHEGVDDGWLCDKGRFAYQHVHVDERITQPLVREGTELHPASWEKALAAAGSALAKAGAKAAALAGGETTNEEAFLLQRLFRERLGSPHLTARTGGELPLDVERGLADPALQASVPDLEFAHHVLLIECDPIDDAPVIDLRLRKGVRHHGLRLSVASARPTALDPSAEAILRVTPGSGEALLVALDAALGRRRRQPRRRGDRGRLARPGRARPRGRRARRGEDVVIVYSERLLEGPRGGQAARALLNVARRLGLRGHAGAGLLEIPASANGRGLREAGFSSAHGPGYAALTRPGLDAAGIAAALAAGELSTLYLLHTDPLRTHPDRDAWEAALGAAQVVIAHESVLTETVRRYADVVFPAEAYAEKEGTLVHPDGRVQRLRPAIGRPQGAGGLPGSGVRAGWQVLAEVSRRAGLETRVLAGPMASQLLFDAVPFYRGLTLDAIGGRGVRWPETEAASAFEVTVAEPATLEVPPVAPAGDGALRLGTFRSLWSSKEVDVSPAVSFMRPSQVVELSPIDAERLGIAEGDAVEVGSNGHRVRGPARLRGALPGGSVFVAAGTREEPANALTELLVEVRRVGPAGAPEPSAVAATVAPAAEGLSEMPPSAPLDIPPVPRPGQSSDGSGA